MRPARSRKKLLVVAVAATLAFAACSTDPAAEFEDHPPESTPTTADGDDTTTEAPSEDHTASEPPESEPAPEPVTVSEFVAESGGPVELEVEVGPLVREGDHAVLPLNFTTVEDYDEQVNIFSLLMATPHANTTWQVRLVDAEALTTSEPLVSGDRPNRDRLATFPDSPTYAPHRTEPLPWLGVFDAPEADSTHVLLPYFGLVEDVPVVDGPLEGVPAIGEVWDDADLTELEPRTFELERYRERTDVHVGTESEGDRSTTTLATDVLFAPDEWELTGEADETLQAAIGELSGVGGRNLEVVGHTDNVDGAVDNQELSDNRAAAVRDRLEDLKDLSVFDEVTTDGRAATEPIAGNDSEEGRAANRRVELHYTSPPEPPALDESGTELPGTEAPTASGAEAVEVTHGDGRTAAVSVDSVRRVGDLFVGRVSVEAVTGFSGEEDHDGVPVAWPLTTGTQGSQDGQGGTQTAWRTDAPTLLAGNNRLFPLSYVSGEDEDGEPTRLPLTDLQFAPTPYYRSGDTATATILWPAVGTDNVTIDVPDETENITGQTRAIWLNPWRLTDVPVE
ncbi:OmpA family protein [Bogoriella caseilytica]|uniref:OmpA family protein n=1 Tax=Bogoriella caseilytica TaxID=56055 RepID=A0A3N2BDU5_9MICO|nr:OmpA family protein [Bogoriella caseilytica]ROR73405.1 OmpA family protein [Bogoriella caseilytica]